MQTKLEQIEELLGTNLQRLTDKLDLHIRQGDKETIQALRDITDAWREVCYLVNADRYAMRQDNTGSPINAIYARYTNATGSK